MVGSLKCYISVVILQCIVYLFFLKKSLKKLNNLQFYLIVELLSCLLFYLL